MSDGRLVQHAGLMDAGAAAVSLGVFLDHLPTLACLLSILWLCIQMYESKTGAIVRRRLREFLIRRGPL